LAYVPPTSKAALSQEIEATKGNPTVNICLLSSLVGEMMMAPTCEAASELLGQTPE
jgi:hypothetical protein